MKYNLDKQRKRYDALYLSKDTTCLYDEYLDEPFFEIANSKYFFPKLFKNINDKIVLDIGCGGGNMGSKISHKTKYMVNMDVSFNALLYARKRIANEKAKYVHGDMLRLPFKETSFDTVLCYASLHHIEDVAMVAKEAMRVLKNKGKFLCFEPTERYPWVYFWLDLFMIPKSLAVFLKNIYVKLQHRFAKQRKFYNVLKKIPHNSGVHFFKLPSQYKEILVKNGVKDVKVETVFLEFLPPRYFMSKNKIIVEWIIKLSHLFHKLRIAKERGRFIIIEVTKS